MIVCTYRIMYVCMYLFTANGPNIITNAHKIENKDH
jgi:hypothetical protein